MRQDEKNLKRCLNGFISIFVCVPRVLKGHRVYETAEWGKTPNKSVLRGRLLELTLKKSCLSNVIFRLFAEKN